MGAQSGGGFPIDGGEPGFVPAGDFAIDNLPIGAGEHLARFGAAEVEMHEQCRDRRRAGRGWGAVDANSEQVVALIEVHGDLGADGLEGLVADHDTFPIQEDLSSTIDNRGEPGVPIVRRCLEGVTEPECVRRGGGGLD